MVGGKRYALVLVLGAGCTDDDSLATTGRTGTETGTTSSTSSGTTGGSTRGPGTTTGSGTTNVDSTTASDTGTSGSTSSTGPGGSRGSSSGDDTRSGTTTTGDSDTGTTSTGPGSSSSDSAGSGGDPVCVDQDLGSGLLTILGDISGAADDWDPPCSPGVGGPDRGHLFTSPVDGFYMFDTLGSAPLDTVLYVYDDATCGGPVLACNDDAGLAQLQSRVGGLFLPQGEDVVVMVDGYDASQAGPYELDIDAVIEPCLSVDLGNAFPVDVVGDNTGAQDKLQPSCAAPPGRDVIFRWVAPANGVFAIDTTGSGYDTVLHVRSAMCSPVETGCNDDMAIGASASRYLAPLFAGTEVTIVVDAFGLDQTGIFELHIGPP